MKLIIKYANYFGFVLALCMMAISGCSCSAPKPTPDPLAGWQFEFKTIDPAIDKDSQEYMQNLPPKEKKYASWGNYYKDETGQHAVVIRISLNGTDWEHILIYDKDNKRIKIITYTMGRYAS